MAQKKDQKTLVLLDSHAIIHRAYHALPEFLSSKGADWRSLRSFQYVDENYY